MFSEASLNLARDKPACQSSDYCSSCWWRKSKDYPSKFAVDGVKDTPDTCHLAHTEKEQNPCWAVDLGGATSVDIVAITTRWSTM